MKERFNKSVEDVKMDNKELKDMDIAELTDEDEMMWRSLSTNAFKVSENDMQEYLQRIMDSMNKSRVSFAIGRESL